VALGTLIEGGSFDDIEFNEKSFVDLLPYGLDSDFETFTK